MDSLITVKFLFKGGGIKQDITGHGMTSNGPKENTEAAETSRGRRINHRSHHSAVCRLTASGGVEYVGCKLIRGKFDQFPIQQQVVLVSATSRQPGLLPALLVCAYLCVWGHINSLCPYNPIRIWAS